MTVLNNIDMAFKYINIHLLEKRKGAVPSLDFDG